jgi:Rrf2 family iron-sulfur cluster assembly transcriptional regulator
MFSKACEYGIRAAIYFAEQSQFNRNKNLNKVATVIDLSAISSSKIFQIFNCHAIFYSIIKLKLGTIKVNSVVQAIISNEIYILCALGLSICNEKRPCSVQSPFKIIPNNLKTVLENTFLQSLIDILGKKLTFLKDK